MNTFVIDASIASDGSGLQKVDPTRAPISTALGVLGMPGMTAYMGLLESVLQRTALAIVQNLMSRRLPRVKERSRIARAPARQDRPA